MIHTDFEKGYIRAQTIAYEDYIRLGGEAGARDAGKLRAEGKESESPSHWALASAAVEPGVKLAEACAAPALEAAAAVRSYFVNGAHETARFRLDDERRAVSALHAHEALVADEDGERARSVVHAIVIAPEDADVRVDLGEAARPAREALGDVRADLDRAHAYSRTATCVRALSSSSHFFFARSRTSLCSRFIISGFAASKPAS